MEALRNIPMKTVSHIGIDSIHTCRHHNMVFKVNVLKLKIKVGANKTFIQQVSIFYNVIVVNPNDLFSLSN